MPGFTPKNEPEEESDGEEGAHGDEEEAGLPTEKEESEAEPADWGGPPEAAGRGLCRPGVRRTP